VVYLRAPESARARMLALYKDEPKPVVWGSSWAPRPGETPESALPRCYGELLAFRDARYAQMAHVVIEADELWGKDDVDAFLSRLATRGPKDV
jgi:hypothetical protein